MLKTSFFVGALVCAASVNATTLVWTGNATGNNSSNLLAAANWSPAQVPQGGDVLEMTKAITLAPCAFDFGSAGLTISNSAKVVSKTTFSGSGKLTIDGAGTFQNDYVCKHTGGTLLLDGELYQSARYENNANGSLAQYPLGTGTFEIRRSAGKNPRLSNQNWNSNYAPLLISGPSLGASSVVISHNNNPNYYGLITAEDDFVISAIWTSGNTAGAGFRGGISAHGHTVYVYHNNANHASTYVGAIDASFNISKGYTWFNGVVGTDEDAILTLGEGTLTMDTTTVWKGQSVSLTSASSILKISTPVNLPMNPELSLATGAKVDLASGLILNVSKLTVNGVEQAAGDYTKSNLAGSITGNGTLRVGPVTPHEPQRITWTGTAGDGLWTTAGNWNPQYVPGAGDTAVFNSAVTLNACQSLIEGGTLTLEANANLNDYVSFSGSGALVKTGSGYVNAYAASSFRGGMTIVNGIVGLRASNALGDPSSTVTLDYTQGSTSVRLDGLSWDPTFKNPVNIKGPTGSGNAIYISNKFNIQGLVTADCDFTAATSYGPLSFNGGVSAPGHTLTYNGASSFQAGSSYLQGTFNVGLTVIGAWQRTLDCQGVGLDHALQLTAGTNTLSSAFTWQGTNVVFSGARTLVTANSSGNLSDQAELRISGGATLYSNVRLFVRRLFVDGVEKPTGTYSAKDLPTALTGLGVIYVGITPNKWIGSNVGDWDVPANWSLNRPPATGEIAVFGKSVIFYSSSGTVDVGAQGLTIDSINGQYLCASNIVFSGEGSISLDSSTNFRMWGVKWTNKGGTNIRCCNLWFDNKCGFGPGPINIIRTASRQAKLDFSQAGTGVVITNDINISGPYDGSWSIGYNNDCTLKGKISFSESDFKLNEGWSNNRWGDYGWVGTACPFSVDAKGRTLYLSGGGLQLKGTYNCSIDASAMGIGWNLGFNDSFRGTDPDAKLTIANTNGFGAAAIWAGTNIVVKGQGQMRLNGAGNIPAAAKLSLEGTGALYIDKGVKAKVAELVVGGVVQPNGIYRAGVAPAGASAGVASRLTGAGRLVVGQIGVVIFVR